MKHLCGKTKFPRYLMWRSFIPEFVLNTIRASAETAEISSWSLSGASCVFQVPNDDFFPNFLLQLRHFFSQTTIRVKALRKISRKSILLWEVGGGVSFNPWFARWLCCFNSHIFCSMPIQFVLFIQFIYIYISFDLHQNFGLKLCNTCRMSCLSWCQGTPCRKSHRPAQEQLFWEVELHWCITSAFSSMSWRPFFTLNKVPCNASAWHLLPFLAIEVHSYKSGVLPNLSAELHQMKQFYCHTGPTEGRNAFVKCIQMLSLSLQSRVTSLTHKLMQKKRQVQGFRDDLKKTPTWPTSNDMSLPAQLRLHFFTEG